jgi:hypothetical protein
MEKSTESRIRAHAKRIWLEEGKPKGREAAHLDMARELVAIEDNQKFATEPNPIRVPPRLGPNGEPIEEAAIQENLGEFPTLTDQGEQEIPHKPDQKSPEETRGKK